VDLRQTRVIYVIMENDLLQVDRLILLLKAVEVEVDFDKEDLHQEIITLATEYLTVGPHVDLYRQRVKKAGFPIYPGEVDRFGWLTAYFQFKWGILLFG
jgi:hypothetical protein